MCAFDFSRFQAPSSFLTVSELGNEGNNAGRALSRDTIMTNVWGYDCMVTPRSIDRFVSALRNKIERDPANPHHIKTVREFGYKFEV